MRTSFSSNFHIARLFQEDRTPSNPPTPGSLGTGCFFRDGKTRIDFMLVWEEVMEGNKKLLKTKNTYQEMENEETVPPQSMDEHDSLRKIFLTNLSKIGLLIEEDIMQGEKINIHYLKLHAPWQVLQCYAEEINLRMPLQIHPMTKTHFSERLLKFLHLPNIMHADLPRQPQEYYNCFFRKSKLDRFLGSDHPETFFSSTQRHVIVKEILNTTPYGKRKKAEVGLDRMLRDHIFSAAFPLHEGSYDGTYLGLAPEQMTRRQVLYKYWARWGCWFKYQPLDHIREYFGEKIAFYFAWLGFYTCWLLPPALVGLVVFFVGWLTLHNDSTVKEICENGSHYQMCPLCDTCKVWNLSNTCNMAKMGHIFDYPGTIFYSIFISLWSVSFLEYWKRKSSSLTYHWGCTLVHEEERPRPEYAALAPLIRENPITGEKEPYFSEDDRTPRTVTGSIVLFLMISVVLIFLVTVILYQALLSISIFKTGNWFLATQATNIANMTGTLVFLVLIVIMARLYTTIADYLTRWEMHRTQSEHENALTVKVFIFQLVNYYSSPVYVGFFKGKFNGYPGNYGNLFGTRNENCPQGGCLIELAQQLFIIMVGKQILNNLQELILPIIQQWRQRRKLDEIRGKRLVQELNIWEDDYELLHNTGLFDEYLEMVMQFGFITIFVMAFPLAPLFALMNNWVEIRLDARKFVCRYRRSVVERVRGIGVWFDILSGLAHISIISNAFLIAFTSDFLPRLLYRYTYKSSLDGYVDFTLAYAPRDYVVANHTMCRYRDFRDQDGNLTLFYWKLLAVRLSFVIIFEHLVFLVARAIDWLIVDVAPDLKVKIKREEYLAKQALSEDQKTLEKLMVDMQPERRHGGGPRDTSRHGFEAKLSSVAGIFNMNK
ncbi:anoctamin-7-like isoform X1 [Petromyzon marinus]|uniref:anoctamin-7-like isoform X1 n=1 Tax=Petromyzon marinus TaxID=7757 RepID=UPI003F7217AD